MGERRAVTNLLPMKYRQATRPKKSQILNDLVELTGWHRDQARAELRRAGTVRLVAPRAPRAPIYTAEVVSAVELRWRAARCPAGKRLAPMLAVLVPMLRLDYSNKRTRSCAELPRICRRRTCRENDVPARPRACC